jgi:hypothetical protein
LDASAEAAASRNPLADSTRPYRVDRPSMMTRCQREAKRHGDWNRGTEEQRMFVAPFLVSRFSFLVSRFSFLVSRRTRDGSLYGRSRLMIAVLLDIRELRHELRREIDRSLTTATTFHRQS